MTLPSYQPFQLELQQASLAVTPAELHGLIVGMLSGGLTAKSEQWQTLLFDYTNDGMAWPVAPLAIAESLFQLSTKQLQTEPLDLELSVLLPETQELVTYAEAVSEWVNHFISGVGLAQAKKSHFSEDVKEALADLEEIAKLAVDDSQDVDEQWGLLEQVIEHIKVCALTVHAELGERSEKSRPETSPKPTLH